MQDNYDDIINLPHHVSKTRPQMPEIERAAQFSPFAALTGYDTVIKETEHEIENRYTADGREYSSIGFTFHGGA